MENAEFVRAKCLTISAALDCSSNYVPGECLRQGFLDFGVSFDSCITATLSLLFSIATPSSVC